MDKSNHSSKPEVKFSIADKLKKAEEKHDEKAAEKPESDLNKNKSSLTPPSETEDLNSQDTMIHLKDEKAESIRINLDELEPAPDPTLTPVTTSDANKYIMKESVGQGGMGLIRSVDDTMFDRTLAMKILSPKHIQDVGVINAFIEEAQITAQLQHPNIIPVHDLGIVPETGNHFYTMKLVDGLSLQEVIERLRAQEPEFVREYNLFNLLTIFKKVCDAVAYAHSKGIIHRDIKPGNIMVGQFGEVLLLDWGLAKHANTEEVIDIEKKLEESSISDSLMTMDGIIKGSLAYLSPEQANGDIKEVDHQTDIFLLGATLYHVLTLQPPYSSKNMVEIIRMAEDASFVHPNETEFGERIPEAVVKIIMRSMEPDKSVRFQSVTELSQKIDDYLQGRNVSDLRTYKAGEILIHDQEMDDDTFIMVKGKVEISRNIDGTEAVIESLGPGAVFGELAALTHDLRTATVKAIEETEVMVISKQLMFDEIRKLPPWLEKVLFNLASKVNSMNERIHPFILSNCSLPVLKQTLYLFSMVNTNAENVKTVSISYLGVIHEISQNLGLSSSRIEEVLDVLEEFNMTEKGNDGRFCIVSMTNIKSLIAYIKREQNITEGIGYALDDIDIEKIPFLDEVYQRMATLHY